ncbi:hypothetical protein B0O99DRAFT_607577 [Bisporella sp. PMI_857]|nr:hypothetical protein B0O99DRAFT_607577 [Bisporella sp. PMI_857]
MIWKRALTILSLAALSPWLWGRYRVLLLFYSNAPERIVKISNFQAHEIKFADRIRSCEDIVLVESEGIAIVGCDAGRERWNTVMGIFLPGPIAGGELYVYDYRGTDNTESLKAIRLVEYKPGIDFHPLGLAYDKPTSTLFVANHRHDGSRIDMFKLDLQTLTARHIRSIHHPAIHAPNSIVVVNDHEFYVTNDHYFLMARSRFLQYVETYLSIPGGSVIHVDISPNGQSDSDDHAVKATTVARVPFANGIELLNRTTLAVASTSQASVYLYSSDGANPPTLRYLSQITLPCLVDNLSVSGTGTLLMAGHPHAPSTTKFAKTRHICNSPADLAQAEPQMQKYCETGQATSCVLEWSEANGVKPVYVGTEFPTSATAVQDIKSNTVIVTGLYSHGLLVLKL